MNRATLGRADLIRWAASLDGARLGRLAKRLGYEVEPERETGEKGGADVDVPAGIVRAEVPALQVGERHRQYCVVQRRRLAPPPAESQPPQPPLPEPAIEPLGPPPPLIPWPRLWPFLRAALGDLAERNRIDLRRLVAACSRAEPLRRLPRLKGQRWAPRGQFILDLHPRLYPFWGDFNDLMAALPRLRGAAGLEILRMDQGPDGPVQPWDAGAWCAPRPYVPPAADTPVLIAGDLGCLGSPVQRQAWVRLGRRLAGSGRQPVALTPCPPRWWDPALTGLYFPVALDRGAHIPPQPVGPRPWPSQAVNLDQAVRGDRGARRLLTLLGACIAIRPSLLRHLRHRLPADLADAGSEAAAWQHPAFVAGDFALLPGDPAEIERLRRALPETGDADQRRLAWDLIRAQQGQGATQAECMEERVLWAALQGRTDPEAEAFLDRVADALGQAGEAGDPEHARFLAAWVNRRSARMHPDAWKYSPGSEALWLLANPPAEAEGARLPAGYDIHRALAAAGRPERPQSWRLVQRGEWLEVEPFPGPEAPFATGSQIVERLATRRPVVQVRERRPGSAALTLPLGEGAGLPLSEAGWWLRTDDEELIVEPLNRPEWAHAQGRDGDGLFVGFDDGRGERRAYWCPPLEWLHWPGSPGPPADESPWDRHGCFIDADQFSALRAHGLAPPPVGASLTSDGHGLRAEIDVKGIPVGFRWIWPGPFPMGSPQSEAGRFDSERRHEVVLTRGYWLAETACTQALWEAVMGENRSYGKGEQRPVELVSWEDVDHFLERLNAGLQVDPASARGGGAAGEGAVGLKPDLQFRLPTEAEWEYACRAGTTTAYAFGDAFDPRLANNSNTTVDVRSLSPNPWGLYEMHGNVWEWCQDWFGDYPSGPVLDPFGPTSGVMRVLRGGSWLFEARLLRSAYRYRGDPGGRAENIGFRLVLGPEPRQVWEGKLARSGAGHPVQGASGSEWEARGGGSRGGARGKGS